MALSFLLRLLLLIFTVLPVTTSFTTGTSSDVAKRTRTKSTPVLSLSSSPMQKSNHKKYKSIVTLYAQSNNNEKSKLAANLDMMKNIIEEKKDSPTKDELLQRLIKDSLDELKQDKRLESKSFSEAEMRFITAVTGVQNLSRRWTNYVCDESVFPQPGFKEAFENVGKAFHQSNEAGRRIFLNLC